MQPGYELCWVHTGHRKPGKSWNFVISFSTLGKSWISIVGHGKSLKMTFMEKITKSSHTRVGHTSRKTILVLQQEIETSSWTW